MNESNDISNLMSGLLIVLVFVLMALVIVYIVVKLKSRVKKQIENDVLNNPLSNSNGKEAKAEKTKAPTYNKRSVFEFMEFDNVQDNMIIQENGRRYLAVIECFGVNYDLMSKMEKVSVEEGFQQFLNTLRKPIQIYVQTRTMNLGKSIESYKSRVKLVEDRYNKVNREYMRMKESMAYSEEDLKRQNFELTRCRNLLEYGRDIITNTERMSLNKNVLTKKYYIIIPYYPEDIEKYDKEEIKNMAFNELYTTAQSTIMALSACSINGKMLDTEEIVELLYMSYNREDADIYGLEKAMQAEYDSLYSTSPDVYEKKIRILDEEINRKAEEMAYQKLEQAKSRTQEKAEEKENDMDFLVRRLAELVLNDNRKYEDDKVVDEALNIMKEEEGGNENVGQEKRTRRNKQ